MREYDWDGNVVWEHIDDHQHHDARRLLNGNAVYIAWQEFTPDEASHVKGGISGTEMDGKIYGEVVREVDSDGKVVCEFTHNESDVLDKYEIKPFAPKYEYGHANTVSPMVNGDYLVSYRVFDLIVIVDRQTDKLKWEYQNHELGGQHDYQELENGNILVFANGHNTPSSGPNYNQVLEIDRQTKKLFGAIFLKKSTHFLESSH